MSGAKISDSYTISEETTNLDADVKVAISEPQGTVLSGYTVITKSMIGAGMFSMAAGAKQFGLLLAIFLLGVAAAITWLSIRVLSKLALDLKETKPSFYSVSNLLVPKLNWVFDVALVINCFGGVIAYVQTFGSLLTTGLWGVIEWDKKTLSTQNTALIVQAAILLALAPLCMMKEISGTKIANMVGLGCIGYIFIMTFFYTPCTAAKADFGELLKPSNVLGLFGSFPTFIFAYGCQQNVFTVANELKDASMKKMNKIGFMSVATGALVYLPLMLLPYMTFGSSIKGTYLANLTNDDGTVDIPVMIAYVLASLSVSISYVLLLQPVRCSLMSLIFGANQPTGRKEKTYRIGLVVFLMLLSYVMAYILGDNLELPINIAGLLGGNTMCFVMPFLFYLKKYGFDKKSSFSIAIMATLVFCLILYPVCLTGIIYGAVNKGTN